MLRGRVNTRAAGIMGSSTKGVIAFILGFTVLVAYFSSSNFYGTPSIDFLEGKDIDQGGRQPQPKPVTLLCSNQSVLSCPSSSSAAPSWHSPTSALRPVPSCPEYFRWIHEDLRPWRATGISREVVESARRSATMRLVVLDGRLYVEEYAMKSGGRNVFTIWGILQLLRRYPGRVPDLDLMFNCMDLPAIKAANYIGSTPPALFHYCNDNETLDINFPDWSFWGMSDQNVKPWEVVIKDIQEGNQIVKWNDREPYAFWKGNSQMGHNRRDIMKCNVSKDQDWNARLYDNNWAAESKSGFKKSGLKSQCVHRYKIYVEGTSWSVSQKNILACDSPALVVTPRYHEFFTRALMPGYHYWPIQEDNKCRSLKFAVDWGNKHQNKGRGFVNAMQFLTKAASVVFVVLLVLVVFASIRSVSNSAFSNLISSAQAAAGKDNSLQQVKHTGSDLPKVLRRQPKPITLNCPSGEETAPICQREAAEVLTTTTQGSATACPDYFRWIYEDLRLWSSSGITREMVESGRKMATFRLVVLNGRVYVEKYRRAFMTRDVFTIWGFVQLVRQYPGRVPDLDLMFNCDDMPQVRAAAYTGDATPPPLFHYDKDDGTADILFPDWSFWGWPEIKIGPWEKLAKELAEANKRVKWEDREPYAYWKGNADMGASRQDLIKCNNSGAQDWNARLYDTNWVSEVHKGFPDSSLVDQCHHKYKIFIEGLAWSVSEKYILACDSPALFVTTHFHEFFSRSLIPGEHYWPIHEDDKCKSIKFAVDWYNKHPDKAREMAKAGTSFVQEQLKMEYVYDYMLHLLTRYAQLLRYKPAKPENGTEVCLESMACRANGRSKEYMLDSMAKWTREEETCAMPPPFTQTELDELMAKKARNFKLVEMWQQESS